MALVVGFKKNKEIGSVDACGQVYTLATGALLDTLKHPFENATEVTSIDYSSHNRSFFGVDTKSNFVFAWSLQRKNRKYLTFNVGVRPHLVSISPCGTFCCAAVSSNIYVWQTASGDLLTILSGHFQAVKVLKFTDDSRFLLSGGDDGLILVWDMVSCVAIPDNESSAASSEHRPPLYKWNEHSQAVTGIVVGKGGLQARVFTTSLDHSFRVWDLLCGRLLLTLTFDVPLTALAVDASETRAFLATESGRLVQINLFAPPPSATALLSTQGAQTFDGHTSPCRNLAITVDGLTLLSAGSTSDDRNVRIWDIPSRQCIRVIKVKGEITDMRLLNQVPPGYDSDVATGNEGQSAVFMLKQFHRNASSLKSFTLMATNTRYDDVDVEDEPTIRGKPVENGSVSSTNNNGNSSIKAATSTENESLVETNRRLYDFLAARILSGSLNNSATSNGVEDDVIIVEHSGDEGEEEDLTPGVKRGNQKGRGGKRAVEVRRSGRLNKKLKKRRRAGVMGTAETLLD